MLPASRLPAHFAALFYFVSILLCLFSSRSRRPTPTYANGTLLRFATWGCSGHTSSFHQESNKYTKCSLTFPLKNGSITFYVNFTNTYVIVNKREVSTLWVPMAFYV